MRSLARAESASTVPRHWEVLGGSTVLQFPDGSGANPSPYYPADWQDHPTAGRPKVRPPAPPDATPQGVAAQVPVKEAAGVLLLPEQAAAETKRVAMHSTAQA